MKTIADIMAIRDKMQAQIANRDNKDAELETRIVVGMATCGIAAGAKEVFNTMVDEVIAHSLQRVKVSRTGCMGQCDMEPMVEVYVPGQEKVTYAKVDEAKAKDIIERHIIGGKVCAEYVLEGKVVCTESGCKLVK